jgi:hypothetical protein
LLEAISRKAGVDYYRCEKCGNVWIHKKDNPDTAPEDATIHGDKPSIPPGS